ncbi:MAG: LysR family transcriptional activator of nhaA [Paraglaciecola sp.]
MGKINFKHLHYFWAVAHEGSIARASDKLNITPQTISGQLTLLEQRLKQPLFERVGRALKITEMGRTVLRYADEIFDLEKELSDVLRGAPAVGQSEFIISAASALPKTIVHKIIEPALQLTQNISLTCLEGPVKSILAELAIHEVDMVLTDTPLTSAYSIKAYNHFLGESALTCFATSALAEQYQVNFPLSLHNAPMLLPTRQYAVRQLFDQWAYDAGIFPIIRGQFDDSALMKSFGQAGEGVFFLPSIIERQVCDTFQVQALGQLPKIKQRFYAISAERRVRHPAVAAICDTARDKIFHV